MRLGRQHKRPLQAFFNLAPPVAAALAAAALCMLVREAWAAVTLASQVGMLVLLDLPNSQLMASISDW